MSRWLIGLLAALLIAAAPSAPTNVQVLPWSGILHPDRGADWSSAGATITHRTTQCGATIAAYTGSSSTINTAITNCPAGQFVQLGTGTFNINSGGICLSKSNVTLRGMGANLTKIVSTSSDTCQASYGASLVIAGTPLYPPSPPNTATWTAGYAKGTTVVTLSNSTNLQVGSLVILDQADDPDSPIPTGLWVCKNAGICSHDGAIQFLRADRNQVDANRVMACSPACPNSGSTQVTLERGLHMPNWSATRSPGAYWATGLPVVAAGVEDLSIDTNGSGQQHGVITEESYGSWILRSRILDGNSGDPKRCLLCSFAATVKNTSRSNYFYGSRAAAYSGTYGYELRAASSNLHENNIWEDNTAPFIQGQGSQGNVFAYNYAIGGWYVSGSGTWPTDCYPGGSGGLNCSWMSAAGRYHALANNYTLFEGNEGNGFAADALRGTNGFGTSFRSYWHGWDAKGGADNLAAGKTQQTVAVFLYAYNRFFNMIGNVLGESGKHSAYQCANATTTDACANYDATVYVLGYSGNGEYRAPILNDTRVRTSLFRWGNTDIVTGSRWCGNSGNTGWATTCASTSEVPAADASYPNAVPSTETLPSSFYLSAKPSWYGAITWPSIGPDVAGTLGPGNRVIKIPARVCYEAMADDPAYSGLNGVRVFNAATCYPGS